MTTRNSHGQLTLTGFLATLDPIDLARTQEILLDSGLSSRVSVKTAVLHPNVITRHRLLASLLEYDAANTVVSDSDVAEDPVGPDNQGEEPEQTTTGEVS